jgi:tagatose 6-phosphate kinase
VILVVAVNPALDVTHHVDSVDWSGVNRPSAVRASAGGKGLNVARVLRALGDDVLLVGLAGGTAGNAVRSALSAADVPAVFAETAGETRRTFAVVDTGRGETAIFNEPGPLVSAAEFADMTALYVGALSRSSAVVLSGSLAPGLPASSYADLIAMATDARVPVLLDTSGEALLAGVAARPAIVKPNLAELDAAVGRGLPAAGRPGRVATAAAAAAGLRDRGADAVVVTLGADGMLAVTADGSWVATTTPVSGNPTGAGDAVAAALARGLVRGSPWPDRLAEAAALGAAAVAAPVAGEFCPADYDRALAGVRVTSWEQP